MYENIWSNLSERAADQDNRSGFWFVIVANVRVAVSDYKAVKIAVEILGIRWKLVIFAFRVVRRSGTKIVVDE